MIKVSKKNKRFSVGIIAVILLFSAGLFSGCITVKMPQYISADNPYEREFYAGYDQTLDAVIDVLEKTGWKISKKTDPLIFEQNVASDGTEPKQVLIFTNTRQKALLLGSRYMTINVLVKGADQKTDVEIRYFSVLSTALKNFKSYRNDGLVEKIFKRIANQLHE